MAKPNAVPLKRSGTGHDIYLSTMEKSAKEKARIFPYVKPGVIVDMGAGAGPVTELLTRRFPESRIVAVDIEEGMVSRLRERFKDNPNVEVVKSGATDFTYPGPVNSILFISVLHEVFSFAGYSHQAVIDTLANASELLADGGRLIIRDGVQPEQSFLYIRPRSKDIYDRFHRFVRDFKARPMIFAEGVFCGDSFIQKKVKDYKEFERENFLIEMYSQDASELLSKYFYEEANWDVELKEQFGIWTLREYQHILLDLGLSIRYAKTYVLPYLLKTHYRKDVELYELKESRLVKAPYPPSTMILVGEKQH